MPDGQTLICQNREEKKQDLTLTSTLLSYLKRAMHTLNFVLKKGRAGMVADCENVEAQ